MRGSLAVALVLRSAFKLNALAHPQWSSWRYKTERKEDLRGNTPGVSMFEPAPTSGQLFFLWRAAWANLQARLISARLSSALAICFQSIRVLGV